MSKIKVNLANGSSVEKPLVTCFKAANGSYLVLDNETNGQMGYPIICISKFDGSNASKINDQNEWSSVKENLKAIISGTPLPYLTVPESISATDDFFTQLTLPVASFDLLKNVYNPAAVNASSANPAPIDSVPVAPATPQVQPIQPVPAPPVENITPAAPSVAPTAIANPNPALTSPAVSTPSVAPLSAVNTPASIQNSTVQPITATPSSSPAVEPMIVPPVINQTPPAPATATDTTITSGNEIETIKENFMKSCENMFDALIKKFENK